jgi:uncharacterized YigZ family protein
MKEIHEPAEALHETNRSKFIAHLVPAATFKSARSDLKTAHPKASHIAWGIRYLNEQGQVVEDFSDDGEPKGCAGMPILQVMRGNGLVDCAILVVRYFGGIKLGTGGMARAYGEAAKKAVAAATLRDYEKKRTLRFKTPYDQTRRWEYELSRAEGLSAQKGYDESGVTWQIEGGESAVGELAARLKEARIPFLLE